MNQSYKEGHQSPMGGDLEWEPGCHGISLAQAEACRLPQAQMLLLSPFLLPVQELNYATTVLRKGMKRLKPCPSMESGKSSSCPTMFARVARLNERHQTHSNTVGQNMSKLNTHGPMPMFCSIEHDRYTVLTPRQSCCCRLLYRLVDWMCFP